MFDLIEEHLFTDVRYILIFFLDFNFFLDFRFFVDFIFFWEIIDGFNLRNIEMLVWRLEFRSNRVFTDMDIAFAEIKAKSVWRFPPSDRFVSRFFGVYRVELADGSVQTVERASIVT